MGGWVGGWVGEHGLRGLTYHMKPLERKRPVMTRATGLGFSGVEEEEEEANPCPPLPFFLPIMFSRET